MAKTGRVSLLIISAMLLFAVGLLAAGSDFEKITITTAIDRDTIGMDEQVVLQVIVTGENQNLPSPKMPTLAMFEVYSQGRSSNLQINNGKITSSVTYRYILLPTKPGTFPIDQIAVIHNNKRHKAAPLTLTVLNKGTSASSKLEQRATSSDGRSRDYFMEAFVDNDKPYVNEQVTLTLKFFIAVQYYGSPELVEPATTGFWTEVLGNKAPYTQTLNNRNYRVIERKYALFPTQTGELEIGRAMIKVKVASRNRRSNDIFGGFFGQGEDVSVRSKVLKVNVKPLPTKGRPADFTGTIGNYKINSQVNKRSIEANQPVSVTVKISGTGNIKSVSEPKLNYDERNFRVYRESSNENISKINDRIGGTKVYEEVFIPKKPGKLSIPAITLDYFDPKAGKYKKVSTKPIELTVSKPEGYIAGNDVPYVNPELAIGADAADIRFIKTLPGDFQQKGELLLFSPLYLLVNGIPVLLLAGLVIARRRQEHLAGNIGLARSRAAEKEAKRRLLKAKKLAADGDQEALFVEIYSAITSFIADKLNLSPHGLTTDSIKELLDKHGADNVVVGDIISLLQKCDFARFAPSSITSDTITSAITDAEQVMVKIYEIKFEQ